RPKEAVLPRLRERILDGLEGLSRSLVRMRRAVVLLQGQVDADRRRDLLESSSGSVLFGPREPSKKVVETLSSREMPLGHSVRLPPSQRWTHEADDEAGEKEKDRHDYHGSQKEPPKLPTARVLLLEIVRRPQGRLR